MLSWLPGCPLRLLTSQPKQHYSASEKKDNLQIDGWKYLNCSPWVHCKLQERERIGYLSSSDLEDLSCHFRLFVLQPYKPFVTKFICCQGNNAHGMTFARAAVHVQCIMPAGRPCVRTRVRVRVSAQRRGQSTHASQSCCRAVAQESCKSQS